MPGMIYSSVVASEVHVEFVPYEQLLRSEEFGSLGRDVQLRDISSERKCQLERIDETIPLHWIIRRTYSSVPKKCSCSRPTKLSKR